MLLTNPTLVLSFKTVTNHFELRAFLTGGLFLSRVCRSLARSSSSSVSRSRSSSSRPGRSTSQSRDIFPKARFPPPQAGPPAFAFIIGGRQMGRRCQGRRFQTSFTPTPPLTSLPPRAYAHKLPVIGRVSKPVRRWTCSHYSLHLPL